VKCPVCRSGVAPTAHFCGVCGHRFDESSADPAGQQDPYIGVVLNDRFVVEAKVGEGGFGAVYKGKQLGTGRQVALKLLHPEMTQDENLVARFRREGLVMCNLRDAHTVTTYDFDQTRDGTLFIAMELLEGKSLHDVFYSQAPIDWRRMLKIASQMCSALAEAHGQGIVHRDLKPENIYLENRSGDPEFVKVLDFGIAKVMRGDGSQAPQLTATGQTLGTLEYMSPEQLMGKELDGRSDIYTVGVLIYEMITGRLPFPDAKGPAALITAQLREVPELPSMVNRAGNIPAAVDQLVLRMLAKDKNQRFANVDELRTAMTEVLQSPQPASAPAPAAALPQGGQSDAGRAVAVSRKGAPDPAPATPARGDARGRAAGKSGDGSPTHQITERSPTVTAPASMVWLIVGLIVLGGIVGAVLALR
jgi:serine/threonine protein kinase